jgi:hypothetical protein
MVSSIGAFLSVALLAAGGHLGLEEPPPCELVASS